MLTAAVITPDTLDSLRFDNRFTRELPEDPASGTLPRQVMNACFSRVEPTRVANPELVAFSRETAERLGISEKDCRSERFVRIFSGNERLPGMDPFAMCYGGHQFGNWAGQLGDGRAINLGDVIGPDGQRQALQLKGAGLTPYSRSADGLAVLRSSIREFICSEAMFHLGVPTTRALSLVLTGETVIRDMFYDGHPKPEPGAIVCRVAPSFIRFGNFEVFTSRQDTHTLKRLVDHTLRTHFPHLGEPGPEVYLDWIREVCRLTAEMIVHWMRVGFVHGVMNTDNMSIHGLTIDYGPYGWLENVDPNWTPNTTDAGGRRYRFAHQPHIAHWNLAQLANAIYPLVNQAEPLQEALDTYADRYSDGWRAMMARKLGLKAHDRELIRELQAILPLVETDMTLFYRALALVDPAMENPDTLTDQDLVGLISEAYYVPGQLTPGYMNRMARWMRDYILRLRQERVPRKLRQQQMNAVNPLYVPRNYLAQLAIDAAEAGDFAPVNDLLEVLRRPYTVQPGREKFQEKRPDWARHRPGCSMLSCSS